MILRCVFEAIMGGACGYFTATAREGNKTSAIAAVGLFVLFLTVEVLWH